jgi:MFS family permease
MSYTTCYPQQFSPYVNYLGLSAAVSGYMASFSMVGNTVGKFGLGAISDKIGIKPAVFLGTVLCLISFGLLLFGGRSVPALMTAALFCGFTMSMTTVGVSLSARHIFGPKDYGTIFSYLSVSQNASYAVGMPLIGFMFDITGSFFLSFTVAFALCIIAFLLLYTAFRGNMERAKI